MTSQTPEVTEIEEFFTQEDEFGYSVDKAASGGDLNSKEYVRELLTPKLHHQLQSIHTSLVAAVEGKKYIEPQSQRAINYNRGIDDTLTIINSIFKE